MTWRKFCDFSYSKPDPDALARLGFDGVLMYLSNTPGKGFDAALAARYHAAGLAIGALYETTANAALGGYDTGVAQAKAAVALAKQVGYPADCVIIYALDEDYSDTQMAGPVSDFVRGLHAVAGPDGEYGGFNQLGYLIKHKLADVGALFQTYAWSGGAWLPVEQAPAEQYRNGQDVAGGVVDLCRIDSSLRLWEPPGAPEDQEVDMPLTADDGKVVWDTPVQNNVLGADGKPIGPVAARVFLTSLNSEVHGMVGTMAGIVKTEAAIQATLTALAAGGGSVDTAALAAQIKAVGDAESEAVTALAAQVTDLTHRLAAAEQAAADALTAAAAPPAG